MCVWVAEARLTRSLQQRRPKNDIHLRNVYYAERPVEQPRASEHVGKMSFAAPKQYSVLPIKLAKYFNQRLKRRPCRDQARDV